TTCCSRRICRRRGREKSCDDCCATSPKAKHSATRRRLPILAWSRSSRRTTKTESRAWRLQAGEADLDNRTAVDGFHAVAAVLLRAFDRVLRDGQQPIRINHIANRHWHGDDRGADGDRHLTSGAMVR